MAKKKSRVLPNVEVLIILVFFLSFITWAASKCKATQLQYLEDTEESVEEPSAPQDSVADIASAPPPSATTTPATAPAPVVSAGPSYSTLYVTIDDLNMRTKPYLNGEVVTKLKLFEAVKFLNEVTDSTQIINLGVEEANEPWVKVRTQKGKEGWVYGAGVHYYKIKRSGVL